MPITQSMINKASRLTCNIYSPNNGEQLVLSYMEGSNQISRAVVNIPQNNNWQSIELYHDEKLSSNLTTIRINLYLSDSTYCYIDNCNLQIQ